MENYKGKATAAMVLGIVGVVLAWFGYSAIGGLVCGILAIVFAIQIKKAGELEGFTVDGKVKAGLVLGIIAVALNAIMFIACVACVGALGAAGSALSSFGY